MANIAQSAPELSKKTHASSARWSSLPKFFALQSGRYDDTFGNVIETFNINDSYFRLLPHVDE